MKRFDRLFGILLLLRGGRAVPAGELARRFGVSRRTIYRDLEALSAAGVPVYAERGRGGGIRLLEGYFLPPLMFSRGEAIALLLGLALLRGLRAPPFPAELETAGRKLLAAVPERLRATLARAERVLGVERMPADVFHSEPASGDPAAPQGERPPDDHFHPEQGGDIAAAPESEWVTAFLQALLDGRTVRLRYRSPYRERASEVTAEPLGLFWDRDRWYLAGRPEGSPRPWQLWRADRVLALTRGHPASIARGNFDVRALLGRAWLREAMDAWRERAPVQLRVTDEQAARLRPDWYYRHAHYERTATGEVLMTLGEDDPAVVLPLLRWLGPGAELVAPAEWRALLREELRRMLARYEVAPPG